MEYKRNFNLSESKKAINTKNISHENKNQSLLYNEISKYVISNLNDMETISVKNVSKYFGISVGYISKIYRKHNQTTYINYVLGLKVNETKKILIEDSKIRIKDIAAKFGYSDTISFIRLFKKMTGMSPGDYRKKYGGK